MARDLAEVQKKKVLAPIKWKKDDPGAKFRSKAEQVMINERVKKANIAAEKARKKVMAEVMDEDNVELNAVEKKLVEQKQLLKTLTATSIRLNKDLDESDVGEKRPVKMQIGKNDKQIATAEEKIAELEDELENLKK